MNYLYDVLQDAGFGLRVLRKNPGFTVVALLTLALGMSANTAVFSVANAILLRPLDVPNSSRLVMIWSRHLREGRNGQASPLDFEEWQNARRTLASIAAIRPASLNLTDAGEPSRLLSGQVSVGFFETLGLSPILGRPFAARDFQTGHHVALINAGLWHSRFGADPAIIGRTIRLDDELYSVLGVMPEVASFPMEGCSVWTPLQLDASHPDDRHFLFVLGRLRDGASVRDAQTEIGVIAGRLERVYPDSHAGYGAAVEPWRETVVGPLRPILIVLFGAVTFVLLIACANVANLLLARNSARTREFSVRIALGASRGRLMRQLLAESTVLSLGGGVLGVFLAHWGVTSLLASLPSDLPVPGYVRNIGIDGRVLLFVGSLSVLAALLFGTLPAFRFCRFSDRQQLAGAGRSPSGDVHHGRLRRVLIVGEIAVTMMLLFAAAVLMRNLLQLRGTDPGLVPTNVLTMTLALPDTKYSEDARRVAFYRDVEERLAAIPGVRVVGAIDNLPFRGRSTFNFTIDGDPRPAAGDVPEAAERVVSPGYFEAIGVPLVRGRTFRRDEGARTTPVVLINEAFAHRYFGTSDPLGRRIRPGGPDSTAPWYTIAGIVANTRSWGLHSAPQAEVYKLHAQDPWPGMALVIRTESDPMAFADACREQIWALDPTQPVSAVAPMTAVMSDALWPARALTVVQSVFGMAALLMAAVGLHGVIAYSIGLRRQEFGVRLALGARPRDVAGLVLKQGLRLSGAGLALGLVGALALGRALTVLMPQGGRSDPAVLGGVVLFLMLVTLLACWLPARRASRIDPMAVLRDE